MNILPNENTVICKECGGHCCKNMPGIYGPGQVRKGRFDPKTMVIDVLEHKTRGGWVNFRVIRPRGDKDGDKLETSLYPPNRCMQLTDTGCALPWERKPLQCKALVPSISSGEIKCSMMEHAKGNNLYRAWKKRQAELEEIGS